MKIFLTLNPSEDLYFQIKLAKNLGFDGVEIVLERSAKKVMINEKEKIREILESLNMNVSFHLPSNLNILEERDFKKIIKLYNIVEYFKSFGVVHIFAENEKEIKEYEDILEEIKNKNLYFENLFQRSEFLEKIYKLNLKFVIDISHFLTVNSFSRFKEFLIKYKPKILHFHFSDSNGISHSHLPFGKGVLPINKIVEFLVKNFNDRTISLEIFETEIPEIDFEISLKILKNLINKYG